MTFRLISSLLMLMMLIHCASACPACGEPVYNPPAYELPKYEPHYLENPHCPIDGFKLDRCSDLLNGLLNLVIGNPLSGSECCPLFGGLVDSEAAACLCKVVKADFLGVHVDYQVKFTLLVSTCGCAIPQGYICV